MVAMAGQVRAQPAEKVPTFDPPMRWGLGYKYTTGVAAADVITATPGGYPELAVCTNSLDIHDGACYDIPNGVPCDTDNAGRVVIFENTGDWSTPTSGLAFAQELALPEYTAPYDVAFVDINSDTKLDLVVTSMHLAQNVYGDGTFVPGNPGVYVFMANTQTGAFSQTEMYVVQTPVNSTARGCMGLSVADLDNDGWPECLVASDPLDNLFGDGREAVHVLKNVPDGTSRKLVHDHVEVPLVSANPPDRSDVVISNFFKLDPVDVTRLDAVAGSVVSTLSAYRNIGNLDFTVSEVDPPGGGAYTYWDLATARLTTGSNAHDDVIGAYGRTISVVHGNGDGTFTHNPAAHNLGGDYYPLSALGPTVNAATADVGHLNGGTKRDVAAVAWSDSLAHILLGKGNGKLQYVLTDARYNIPLDTSTQAGINPARIIIADMDQDGFDDLVATGNGFPDTNENDSTSVVVVLINKFELTTTGP